MSPLAFVQRLITKRCAMFCGSSDDYILISGKMGYGEHRFTKVGTDEEVYPLTLENTLSYHEMKVRL